MKTAVLPITEIEALWTNADVCRHLGISDTHLDRLNKRGRIPAIRTRAGRLYTPEAVEAFARDREARKNGQQ